MNIIKLSRKGQLVIPKELRDEHRLAADMEFLVRVVGDEIRLKPLPLYPPSTVAQGACLLEKPKRRKMSAADTQHAIAKLLGESDQASKK